MAIALGLDLSLTGSGVAIIRSLERADASGDPRNEVTTMGRKGSNSEPLLQRLDRIVDLAENVAYFWTNGVEIPDIAMIETPAYDQSSGKTHDRSGLWWKVVELLHRQEVPIVEVGTSKVKIYGTGKGTVRKDAVMAAAIRRYPDVEISNNNESDGYILAAMGMRLLGKPVEESLPQTHLRAMEGLALP